MDKWSGSGRWGSRWAGWKERAGRRSFADNRLAKALAARRDALLIVGMAFLLGRAMILEELSPFALAFLAVVSYLRKDLIYAAGAASLAGALLAVHAQLAAIACGMALFLLIRKGLERFERADIAAAPLIVMITAGSVRLFALLLTDQMHWYPLMLAGIEAVLGFVLTLIFTQALPVLMMRRKKVRLRTEEVVCLIILLASVMTGMVGWSVEGLSAAHIMSRYLILVFAVAGGALIGASVGVIAGLILSLADITAIYQIGLLAFAGMLAGLMREAGRMGTAVGMLIGSTILSLYIGEQSAIAASTWESAVAVLAFLLTPRALIKWTAQYVPGTKEYDNLQQDYARRVREVTAGRVQQFSEVFRRLAASFVGLSPPEAGENRERESEHFMNAVAERLCSGCPRQTKCWDSRFAHTYRWMTEMMSEIEAKPNLGNTAIKAEWRSACVKPEEVLAVMKQEYALYRHNRHWKRQIAESRQLVAEQLSGVSQVMEDLAREIRREGQALHLQEEQIRQALEQLGLPINSIEIISLEEGKVEIEIVHPYRRGLDECRKIIAPLLSDILGENIAVKREETYDRQEGLYTVLFGSAKEYEVETGVAGAAKGGGLLSGDSFTAVELGNGKFAVALSDGMGNGERAHAESRAALEILEQLLKSGMDEQLAVKSVNSVLLLRTPDEMFATIDVALIDQYTAQTSFLKNGSTPSFIKRGSDVITVSADGLPAGILKEIDVQVNRVQLAPGDILIMMTDGVLEAPRHAANKEIWMRRIIQELKVEDPQDVADCLLETAVRHHRGEIPDDMTVVVARIDRYRPEWSTFRWPGLSHIERPKVVS